MYLFTGYKGDKVLFKTNNDIARVRTNDKKNLNGQTSEQILR